MLATASIKKRLEAIEQKTEGSARLKIFILHMERNPPIWEPKDPVGWQKSNPKGQVVILKRKSCRKTSSMK